MLEAYLLSDRTLADVPSESRVFLYGCGGGCRSPRMQRFDQCSRGIVRSIDFLWGFPCVVRSPAQTCLAKFGGTECVLWCLQGRGQCAASCRSAAIGARRWLLYWRLLSRIPCRSLGVYHCSYLPPARRWQGGKTPRIALSYVCQERRTRWWTLR